MLRQQSDAVDWSETSHADENGRKEGKRNGEKTTKEWKSDDKKIESKLQQEPTRTSFNSAMESD